MYLDPIIVQMPEGINIEDYIIATYYSATRPSTEMLKYAASLSVEQSTGTWTKVPAETDKLRENHIGRVIGVYETPSYQYAIPNNIDERHFIIRIAYPHKNFSDQFAMLLSTTIGNIASAGKLKLLDLEIPKSYLQKFQGPKFGIQGIRNLLEVYDRPLLNNMIKPCTGLNPKETAELAYEAAVGGVDIVKDDELVADANHCKLVDRVKYVMEAIEKADSEKGEKTLYAFNITDRTEKLQENAYKAIEAGANCLMINYMTVGLDSTRMLTEDAKINVPILAHSDFAGAIYESPISGVSASLIVGKLPRMAGIDMQIVLSPYGKFSLTMDTFLNTAYQLKSPFGKLKPAFAMPGGGTTQGHVAALYDVFGKDVIIAAGGAIHGHPMGAVAGAKAFRQAIDAVVDGKSLVEAKNNNEELRVALDQWGIWGLDDRHLFAIEG